MGLFGAHMSIVGGFHNALLSAAELGCQTVQLFTKAPNQWDGRSITSDDIAIFRRILKQTKLRFPTAHDSYLINLASPDPVLYRRSVDAFVVEMQRAEALGLRYLVTHPGAHLDSSEVEGLNRVAQALDEAHQRCRGFRVRILLETTAGQGTTLGHRFEHLAKIMRVVEEPRRLGVCFDTCHVFAAGYELWPKSAYDATFREFNRLIGLSKLRVFHLNDSLKPWASRVDRHAHIGRGQIGLEPFRLLVNDERFRNRPMILETPKESEQFENMDFVNLSVLRDVCQQ